MLLTIAKWTTKAILSPTRGAFEMILRLVLRGRPPVHFYYIWSVAFLALSLGALFTFYLKFGMGAWPLKLRLAALWLLPVSRIVEISYTFWADAKDRLARKRKRTPRLARLNLLAVSYFELAVDFAILYCSLPVCHFAGAISSPMDALYFSWATITTTGYGDVSPKLSMSRSLAMIEVGLGLMLIVFAVGSYLSSEIQESEVIPEGIESPLIQIVEQVSTNRQE